MPSDDTGLLQNVLDAGFRLEMVVVSLVASVAAGFLVYDALLTATSTSIAVVGAGTAALALAFVTLWISLKMDV